MRSIIILSIIFTFSISYGQNYATTDKGERIVINTDGTWKPIKELSSWKQVESYTDSVGATKETKPWEDYASATSYIHIENRKLISGIREYVHKGKFDDQNILTSISIAKEGDKTLFVIWQETEDCFAFQNENFQGNVILYLRDNNAIKLIDREMNGQSKKPGGSDNGEELCQRFAIFYLTQSECAMLKSSDIFQISYHTNQGNNVVIELDKNTETAKTQLIAIGR